MNLLRKLAPSGRVGAGYPFTVPTIASLPPIEFRSSVTFFAGGNGTGKSTLLEAIGLGTNRLMVSGAGPGDRSALEGVRELADALRFEWNSPVSGPPKGRNKRGRPGFFLRAEDFLDYKRGLTREIAGLRTTADEYGDRMEGYGLALARAAALGQAEALVRHYGDDLDAMSHGESFLRFFRSRFTGPGLYLLDEPDTALSPQSVLGLVAALGEMTGGNSPECDEGTVGAQFIVATHNPILLAFPGAQLISFDRTPIAEVGWDELEQVALMRDFLDHPQVYLRHLGLGKS